LNSRSATTRFSGKAVARRTAVKIHLLLLGLPIQEKAILFSSHAENKGACCLQTVNSPRCLVDGIFDMSFTVLPELTVGNSRNERLPVLFRSLQHHRTSDANPKH
jgi:hypothetical protein